MEPSQPTPIHRPGSLREIAAELRARIAESEIEIARLKAESDARREKRAQIKL
jgi:hypothetical protein